MSTQGSVSVSSKDSACEICFSHPKANCFPLELLEDFTHAIREAENDSSCKVLVVKSAGEKAFSADTLVPGFDNSAPTPSPQNQADDFDDLDDLGI